MRSALKGGQHCLITGASSGIGLALSRRLLDTGWRVTGLDLKPTPIDAPERMRSVELDLLDGTALERGLSELVGDPPTAFVHSAGLMRTGGITETRDADLALLWTLHVGAAVALMRGLAAYLPDGTGRVILLGSRGALGRAGRGAYAATKSALVGLARSWAIELAPRGVTVNVIAPGATDTPMLSDPLRGDPPQISMPIGRLITADEVAAVAAFLLGAEAGAITGQTIYVCGGSSLGVAL